jgi:hypothetical protein
MSLAREGIATQGDSNLELPEVCQNNIYEISYLDMVFVRLGSQNSPVFRGRAIGNGSA